MHAPLNRSCLKLFSSPNAIDLENKLLHLNSLHIMKFSDFNVFSNDIGSEMAEGLALLLKNTELESVLLSDNSLQAFGFSKIAKALKLLLI